MIVELEAGVWLADGDGDPPRTLRKENARHFTNTAAAAEALTEARRYRPFPMACFVSQASKEGG